MRVRLRERDPQHRRWSTILDQRVSVDSCTRIPPLSLNESSELILFVHPEMGDHWAESAGGSRLFSASDFDVRIVIGNFVVASSRDQDRSDFNVRLSSEGQDEQEYYFCSGRLLRDWVGETRFQLEVRRHEDAEDTEWCTVLDAELSIAAGKLEQQAFETLCAEIADYSADLLLDVYGKTFVNLQLERRPGDQAPVLALQRIRQVIDQIEISLRAIARRPAYRLKSRKVREPVVADQAVTDLTLEETCIDPTLAVSLPDGQIRFREHVREEAIPNYDLLENRIIAGFLEFLAQQIHDLQIRIESEIGMREERRVYRHRRSTGGGKTWWESEDLPRIQELTNLLDHIAVMGRDLKDLQRSPFLPRTLVALRQVPQSTPLFRSHKAYSNVFNIICNHYQAFRVQIDDKHLVMQARSLPVLYEWWCLLDVMRCLRNCLTISQTDDPGPQSPFRRLQQDRDRFVVDLGENQQVDFKDETGNTVRLRYVPLYQGWRDAKSGYGLLGDERERTPDIALEIYLGDAWDRPPDLLIVLDAKYSSEAHRVKLDEVKRKYGKIGIFETGKVLSQQVWAMTPAPAGKMEMPHRNLPEWSQFCTVDNIGFWSEHFDITQAVAGVVQAKPKMPAGRTPLDSLLRLLLKRAGLTLKA